MPLSLVLVLSFCMPQKEEVAVQPPSETRTVSETQPPPAAQFSIVAQPSLESAQQHFAQGDFQKAIEECSIARQKYPDNEFVLNSYIQILEEIKTSADEAFEKKEYAQAAKRYSVLFANFQRFRDFEGSLSFGFDDLRSRKRECLFAETEIQARRAMQGQDYTEAIGAYRAALQVYPGNGHLKEDLVQKVEEILGQGEKSLDQADYAAAGKAFSSILKDYAWLKDAGVTLPPARTSLEETLGLCTKELTIQGLKLYREGDLEEAIAVWKGILEFDPENAEIKKAIANADEQLKKIKKMFPGVYRP